MSRDRILAFAQLTRIPNVFTAFADIALAVCVALALNPATAETGQFWGTAALLCLASGCLYLSGMVWNDVFDAAVDAQERPFRPIPSKRVSVRTAIVLASVLMFAGTSLALLTGILWHEEWDFEPFAVVVGLIVTIFLYNAWLKNTWFGPVAMSWCRTSNLALGLTLVPVERLPTGFDPNVLRFLLGAQGWYIIAITTLAKNEVKTSSRWTVILVGLFFAISATFTLFVRVMLPSGLGTILFPYLLVAFGFWIGLAIARAYRKPGPREVQTAVKRCIMGIAVYDAVLASMFIGAPGMLIVLLLLPAYVLGKWVYST